VWWVQCGKRTKYTTIFQNCSHSVVGRSMSDIDGPFVAEHVYKELFMGEDEYLDPNVVPYALDEAVQQLRARNLPPSRWATFIHLGM
jgi:hypothetical protein